GQVLVRLHLGGLEGFKVTVGERVFSGAYHPPGRNALKVRMLDAQGKALEGRYLRASTGPKASRRIPGYYEAEVPQLALQGGASKIDLDWVDFYRR
ncbi:MAG: hypothetical protein VCG02_01095, partial [Verrucomicrobiota bacterium]